MTYDIRHVVVIESTMYRKDIKVYIKQETVYDIASTRSGLMNYIEKGLINLCRWSMGKLNLKIIL